MNDIIEVEDGFLIKVPSDIKNANIYNWNDDQTIFEFESKSLADKLENADESQQNSPELIKIKLPTYGDFKIKKSIPRKYYDLIDVQDWYHLVRI